MIGSEGVKNAIDGSGLILRENGMPMWIYDRRTLRFLEVSDGAVRHFGFTREEFLQMNVHQLRSADGLHRLNGSVPSPFDLDGKDNNSDADYLDSSRVWTLHRKDGASIPVRISSNALLYNGQPARLVVAETLAQRQDVEGGTGPLAQLDVTTGLPTRLQLEHRAHEACELADRTRRRVAVVCLDLDNHDDVKERLGNDAADDCLKQVANLLTRRVRGMDTVARTGLKAFTLILAELDDDFDLVRVAEALLKTFAEPLSVAEQPVMLSASIGIAVYPNDGLEIARLCRSADMAMQQARARGGDRIAMFSLAARERTELAAYMRESMRADTFQLHYQPQYSAAGEICKFEALLRLPGKESGFISPDLFIPIAEESGMIEQLGMWVIEAAACQARDWHRHFGSQVHIAVNVSPLQLSSQTFADKALAMIDRCGTQPGMIEFEITERAVLNFDEVAEPMRQLTQAGIVFAVDDFGTGYSSLQHLHRLPISVLKIDRSFVQRMGVPRGTEAIVEAIVSMAHSLGMQVVAEGVETQAQRDAATRMGCDAIQGFLHSPAIEADRVPDLAGWVRVAAAK